ncbi:NAD-dependent epimerase/dehydratase family protein [Auritidibacter ignavus]|uniref:NAD-dependent epimerase/dehydratase family protein n=1 Tax=Auritidibacter ignavus TaxID=678932 RepID=UPI00244D7468|nr:NAD-dependent epimerase/dehydratase family protein [Auritidibacter ignavus]WGH84524.1 NAD(P)H-binding protein [Auritidibacter ignavus]WGH86839.1 NAD(P)H-binding protein [Auritidibacter ignavus]WGH89123.1 NAD(P)H-binding protein [Auritidibacter ignavus]
MTDERRVAVIGASGQIGRLVVSTLTQRGVRVAAISRRRSDAPSAGAVSCREISSYEPTQLEPALADCTDVIATVGLPYRARIWNQEWPGLVRSIVSSTESRQTPLTFLDNLYVYGRAESPISESQPMAPCSEKGSARLKGTEILSQARAKGHDVVICRSADFLGPGSETTVMPWSSLEEVVMKRKRTFRWFGRPDNLHSFALPRDVARGLAEVCLDSDLRSTLTLHMPAITAFSANDLSHELSSIMGRSVKPAVLGRNVLAMAGVLSTAAREQREMMYQFESDYTIDDSTFRSRVPDFPRTNIKDVVSMLPATA